MRTCFIAILVAVLPSSAVLAASANRPKVDYVTPPDRLPPPKSAAASGCAAFGPGFVKVEGTDTCVKVGGSIMIGVGGVARPR
jgi:hypothetical protein